MPARLSPAQRAVLQAAADRDETLHRRRINPGDLRDALMLPRWVNPEFADGLEQALRLLVDQNDARARIIKRLRAENARLRKQAPAGRALLATHGDKDQSR